MKERLRILVVRLTALGDVLFTLPAVRALRAAYPEARIDWVVEDVAACLLAHERSIDRLIVYPRRVLARAGHSPDCLREAAASLRQHLSALRLTRYHVVLDFQGNAKSGLHCLLARAKRKIGHSRRDSKELSYLTWTESMAPCADTIHRIDRAMRLARTLGVKGPPLPGTVETGPEAEALARRALRASFPASSVPSHGADSGIVVLHPGTSTFGAFKRWSPERYGALARHIEAKWSLRTLVTWGPGEEDLARRVERESHGAARVCAPLESVVVLGALLGYTRLFVGADSAPLHLASFSGVPVVALFGPKDPAIYGPRGGSARVVRSAVPCSPCRRRRCPDALCMTEITVDRVARACDELLGKASEPLGMAGS